MADAVTATNAATQTGVSIANSRTRLATNYETFLSLLTTQLKNQDPTSPLDTNQFTQQLTQMTGVEQQLMTNELLTKLVAQTGAGGVGDVVSLIGKSATATTDLAALKDGKASWDYALPRAAADSSATITNANGQVVWTGKLAELSAGAHSFSWDGKTSAGATAPAGSYKLTIAATDSNGSAVAATTSATGLVSGVETADGETYATVAGVRVAMSSITSVRQPDS